MLGSMGFRVRDFGTPLWGSSYILIDFIFSKTRSI